MMKPFASSVCLFLSIAWFISSPDWEAAIAVLSFVGVTGGLLFSSHRKIDGTILVEDIITEDYPPIIDFRLRNTASRPIGITRVLFKVFDLAEGPSPIGGQEISDTAEFALSSDIRVGDVLSVPVAVKVAAHDTDRLVLRIRWSGDTPDIGKYYRLVPALKTSAGFVQCTPFWVHIQEDFEKSSYRYADPDFVVRALGMKREDGEIPVIDWVEEEKAARDARN